MFFIWKNRSFFSGHGYESWLNQMNILCNIFRLCNMSPSTFPGNLKYFRNMFWVCRRCDRTERSYFVPPLEVGCLCLNCFGKLSEIVFDIPLPYNCWWFAINIRIHNYYTSLLWIEPLYQNNDNDANDDDNESDHMQFIVLNSSVFNWIYNSVRLDALPYESDDDV